MEANCRARFLLVHLQMNYLCSKRRPSEVRKSLNTLAKDVHQFYDDCFQRLDASGEEDKQFALKVLSYVFYARRPLTMDELLHALSIDPDATDLVSEALYQDFIVFSVSSGLIRIDEESSRVRLAHHTLHEHLQKYPEKLSGDHKRELAIACLTYLSFEAFAAGPCAKASDMVERLDKYCFLEYACRHWAYHASDYKDEEMRGLIFSVLRHHNRLASCVQVLHLPQHRTGNYWHNQFPTNFTCVHAAAYWGLNNVLNDLVKGDAKIACKDGHGTTPLLLSARHGHTHTVRCLLEMNAEMDISNNLGETALVSAARNGHEEAVKLLLSRGASQTAEDIEGWTALHWAIMGGYNSVVQILLSAVTHNQSDNLQHNKALILAAEVGSHTVVQMLLKEGADVDYKDDEGSTPLHWAVPEGHMEASRVLLSNYADPSSRDHYNNTPMHWTVSHCAISRLLADYGADVNAKNSVGQSTLLWSALAGKMDTVETLLELGADINQGDRNGFTALHAAALNGHEPMIRLLLGGGADANRLDRDGWTALQVAALKGRAAVIELLVGKTNHGHDINSRMKERLKNNDIRALMEEMADRKSVGSSVVSGLRSAINSDHDLRLLALLENGADIDAEDDVGGSTALSYAAWFGREKTVRLLLDRGANVDLRDRSGRTALHWAAHSGYLDIVTDLVERGRATIDATVFGWTAMLLAARTWQPHVVTYLVEHGANVGVRDFHGRNALHWSCIHGDKALAKELLRRGVEIDARDHSGQTALHWAVAFKEPAIAKMLLRQNAEAGVQACDGSTPLHLGAYTGQLDVVNLLFSEQERRRRRSRAEATRVAPGAFDLTITDKNGFTALDMAHLTGNLHVEKFLRGQQTGGLACKDDDHSSSRDIFSNTRQKQQQVPSLGPSLQLYRDAEHDYLSEDRFADGLGRALISREVRQWLLEKSNSNSPLRLELPLV